MGKIISTHITITVPRELREQLDEVSVRNPETNWSLVARRAIQQHIQTHTAASPQVGVSLGGTQLIFNEQMGPVLKTLLVFQNRTPIDIIVDKIGITQTLLSGVDKFIASRAAWNMNAPFQVSTAGRCEIADFFPMAPRDLFASDELVTSSLTVKSSIEAFVQGFHDPVRAEVVDRIPLEEWKYFMKGV